MGHTLISGLAAKNGEGWFLQAVLPGFKQVYSGKSNKFTASSCKYAVSHADNKKHNLRPFFKVVINRLVAVKIQIALFSER